MPCGSLCHTPPPPTLTPLRVAAAEPTHSRRQDRAGSVPGTPVRGDAKRSQKSTWDYRLSPPIQLRRTSWPGCVGIGDSVGVGAAGAVQATLPAVHLEYDAAA